MSTNMITQNTRDWSTVWRVKGHIENQGDEKTHALAEKACDLKPTVDTSVFRAVCIANGTKLF